MEAIYAADLHNLGERPIARLDENWIESQRKILEQIVSIANLRKVPLVLVGDVFDHSRVATEVINMVIAELQKAICGVYILAGNHDLPGHSFEQVNQSSIGILLKIFNDIEKCDLVNGNHFGRDRAEIGTRNHKIQLVHQLVFENKEDCPPNGKAKTADQILDEHPNADWIICGDMHQAFHYIRKSEGGARHVLNLGCTIRHKANELDYTPSVWYVNPGSNIAERIELDDDPNMISRQHLDIKNEKESRIDALWGAIKTDSNVKLDFLHNLEVKVPSIEDEDTANEVRTLIELCKVEK